MAGLLDLSGYKLTFDDEFNGFSQRLSGSGVWDTAYWWGGRTNSANGEMQYYSDSSVGVNPFSLRNGALDISAAPSKGGTDGLPYTSGIITTEESFSQAYGYFEMRAQLPSGKGLWPAFWLLPVDRSWPPEIDAMEAFGDRPNQIHYAAHYNTASGKSLQGNWVDLTVDITSGYHAYGVKWTPSTLTYYVDQKQIAEIATPPGVDKPMYMLANLAVGGNWPGAPDATTPFPTHMSIDYIRAYSNDPNAVAVPMQPVSSPDGTTEPSGSSTIVVNAAGVLAGGVGPHFNLLVDGVKIGEGMATNTAKDFTFTSNAALGVGHKVQVQYDNDTAGRDLIVNKISINGKAHLPTESIVSYDKGALDGKDVVAGQSGMWWNGTLVVNAPASDFPVSAPPAALASKITVNASGTPAGGVNAHFNLLIDGKKVGEGVAGTTAKDFVFSPTVSVDAAHKVQVQFDNDAYINGQDRNLIVNKITINGKAVLPTAPIVTYDKGALDGKDVIAGQSGLWWNGTLVVNADKTYFPAMLASAAQQSVDPDPLSANLMAQAAHAVPFTGHDAVWAVAPTGMADSNADWCDLIDAPLHHSL